MANVIAYGTFDLFHVGHLRLLQRARALALGEKNFFTMGSCIFESMGSEDDQS